MYLALTQGKVGQYHHSVPHDTYVLQFLEHMIKGLKRWLIGKTITQDMGVWWKADTSDLISDALKSVGSHNLYPYQIVNQYSVLLPV